MFRLRPYLAVLLALCACQSRPQPPERGSSDPAVVLVLVTSSDGEEGRCTGVVIAPHLVLTAAHCLSRQTVGSHPKITLFLGGDYDDPVRARRAAHRVEVAATAYDPAFDANVLPAGHDVGLVMARTPLGVAPLGVSTTPLPARVDGARLVGYGITNPDAEEPAGGVRRALQVRVRHASTRFIELDDTAGRACAGDSGGPVLARPGDGAQEVVVGIVSYGDTGCRRGTLVTNLAPYASYLRDFIARDTLTPTPPAATR